MARAISDWVEHAWQRRRDPMAGRLAARSVGQGSFARLAEPAAAAPAFALLALDGSRVTGDSLLAPGKPVLLLFTDPRCGPCYELLPDVGGWQRVYGDRLTIALISGGAPEANWAMTAEYGIAAGSVLLQAGHEVAEAYGLTMAPAAVLLRTDGALPGQPVYGASAVRQLVADSLGLALPPSPAREVRPARGGEAAPRFRRPDLDGIPTELVVPGEATLLLFWSPGCQHCRALLPEIAAWGAQAAGSRLLIVSRGPVALNREAGFAVPVVLDDDRSLAAAFGVSGTPAAVMIDAAGIVASGVARGASDVRALAAPRFTPVPAFAD